MKLGPVDRDQLILAGVRSLSHDFPTVTTDNILTDYIFASFFKSSLELTRDEAPELTKVINSLIKEIEPVLKRGLNEEKGGDHMNKRDKRTSKKGTKKGC